MKPPLFFLKKVIILREFGVIIAFLIVTLFFIIQTPYTFLSAENLSAIFTVSAELGIVSLAVSLLMICGEFDLSVGSVFCFSSMHVGILIQSGIPAPVSILIILLTGCMIGLVNGLLVTVTNLPSFIVTLGMMMFLRGIILMRTAGWTVYLLEYDPFLDILSIRIGLFRISIIWFIILTVIFAIILENTTFGNKVLAVGGNREAARAVGVNPERTKRICYVFVGLMSAFAGIVNMSRFHAADPTLGEGLELETIAASVIGGNLLTGGYGSIIGTFLGVLLIGIIRSGLVLIQVPGYFYQGLLGLIIIITGIINKFVIKMRLRKYE